MSRETPTRRVQPATFCETLDRTTDNAVEHMRAHAQAIMTERGEKDAVAQWLWRTAEALRRVGVG